MAAPRQSVLHQQALLVMGFFAGFALTALVAVLQAPATFRVDTPPFTGNGYLETLATAIALVGSVSIVGVLATMEVAGGLAERGSAVDRLGYACFLVALFGLMAVLPMLLLPLTEIGAVLVFVVEFLLVVLYFASSGVASRLAAGGRGPRP